MTDENKNLKATGAENAELEKMSARHNRRKSKQLLKLTLRQLRKMPPWLRSKQSVSE